jgi:hypothetical protein
MHQGRSGNLIPSGDMISLAKLIYIIRCGRPFALGGVGYGISVPIREFSLNSKSPLQPVNVVCLTVEGCRPCGAGFRGVGR